MALGLAALSSAVVLGAAERGHSGTFTGGFFGDSGTTFSFSLHDKAGLHLNLEANSGGFVALSVTSPRQLNLYATKGAVSTEGRVRAGFAHFGRVALEFKPLGKPKPEEPFPGCHGKPSMHQAGVFVGRLRFHGERGFAEFAVDRARGEMVKTFRWRCRGGGGTGEPEAESGEEAVLTADPEGSPQLLCRRTQESLSAAGPHLHRCRKSESGAGIRDPGGPCRSQLPEDLRIRRRTELGDRAPRLAVPWQRRVPTRCRWCGNLDRFATRLLSRWGRGIDGRQVRGKPGTSETRKAHSRYLDPIAEPSPNGQVVAATNVTRRYGEASTAVDALRGVSLGLGHGSLTAIMGPSGSGKSTLMHILAGLDRPTSGSVSLGGTEITGLGDNELTKLRRRHIGFVFQFFNLLPMLTAEENILLPQAIAGTKPDEDWLADLIGRAGLDDRRSHRPAELSGGQQQRVAIVRALVSKPTVVFADEPTGNLDSASSAEILDLLRSSVDAYGQTTLMVTHDAAAAAVADRVLFLADGRIVSDLADPDVAQVVQVTQDLSTR